MMRERTPYDGKPYYCETCRLGWGEYMACENGDCALESELEAAMRAKANADQFITDTGRRAIAGQEDGK